VLCFCLCAAGVSRPVGYAPLERSQMLKVLSHGSRPVGYASPEPRRVREILSHGSRPVGYAPPEPSRMLKVLSHGAGRWLGGCDGLRHGRSAAGFRGGMEKGGTNRRLKNEDQNQKRPTANQRQTIKRHENINRRSRHESSHTENRIATINPTPKSSFWRFPCETFASVPVPRKSPRHPH
jgi:hypothetical protein